MKKIRVKLSIGINNAYQKDELEVPEESTEDEIEAIVRAWAENYIDWNWEEV